MASGAEWGVNVGSGAVEGAASGGSSGSGWGALIGALVGAVKGVGKTLVKEYETDPLNRPLDQYPNLQPGPGRLTATKRMNFDE